MKNFKKNSKIIFSITVLAILDNSDFSIFFWGGAQKNKIKILELSEMARTFIEKSLGQSLLGEKVRAERREERERRK